MNYDFKRIEAKWQQYWAKNQTFTAENNSNKEKFYVLDMFPYPSGAGLHVGHPLGYIASDIYTRYKRHQGYNVLHPMGYDSFGLPAEQYAIQTGLHPAVTTSINIDGCLDSDGNILSKYVNADGTIKNEALIDKNLPTSVNDKNYRDNIVKGYRKQLDKIGFSFDWSREVRTSNPNYYKWTQWVFIQLFNSWYNKDTDKAEDISSLISILEKEGNASVNAVSDGDIQIFAAEEWKAFDSKKQQQILLQYRLTYLARTEVNWCPALGTVLANDEIVNGVSERGGHPVVRKKMTQWSMRISAYAQRLLDDLNTVDWPHPLKDSQTNWIGRSEGTSVRFHVLSLSKEEMKADPDKRAGYTTGKNNSHLLIEKAKEMPANTTNAEAALWSALRGMQLDTKFRRQHLIGNFIVDFVCLDKKLIVEIDGKIHESQQEKDTERTSTLNNLGYETIRFKNEEVLGDLSKVLNIIIKELEGRKPITSEKSLREETLASEKGLGWEIEVFTTRPDTIFGVSFMTLAPEHDLVVKITTPEQKVEVDAYIKATAKRSERDRMSDVKTISGVFTGAYAEHPFTKEPIPIWIGDYVLAGYGTGAVMSVPCGDQRDYDFAKHFNIPIPNIFEGVDILEGAFADKDNTIIANSDFLNGMKYKKAVKRAIYELEQLGQGEGKINYRLRDAVFSRQRYWGEPFPVYYVDGMPQMIAAEHLPIKLPEVEKYLPTETGEPPLGNATVWAWDTANNRVVPNSKINNATVWPLELNTMPGWAGSSFYFNRYMDPDNENEVFSQDAVSYWQDVDLYIGGSEHATGHLLYARFWQKFLFDKGMVPKPEFAKKLINQGMITGTSAFVYRLNQNTMLRDNKDITKLVQKKHCDFYFSKSKYEDFKNGKIDLVKQILSDEYGKLGITEIDRYADEVFTPIRADVSFVNTSDELDIEAFKNWRPEYKDAKFVTEEDGAFKVSREVEKMSKSKYNVVSPDNICEEYGADSLRLYEMFLGPLEQSKPWNTAGISGVHSFLKKLWRLYIAKDGLNFTNAEPTKDNLKTLHKTIKKVKEDIENFSFNTSVSTFMICVNELSAQKCTSKEILEGLAVLVSPYAPHIAEELWEKLGHTESISKAPFPKFNASHLVESSKEYPISFNGKMRFTIELPLDMSKEEIETAVMAHEKTQVQLQGRTPKKVIVVPGKIVNIVG